MREEEKKHENCRKDSQLSQKVRSSEAKNRAFSAVRNQTSEISDPKENQKKRSKSLKTKLCFYNSDANKVNEVDLEELE